MSQSGSGVSPLLQTIWAGAVAGVLLSLGLCARGELGVMPEDWQKATDVPLVLIGCREVVQ